jgi:hypothetical protein
VPLGIEGKPVKSGANGCATGAGLIFALKGNNTRGFYRYDVASDSWQAQADVPLGTSGRKVKGGADMAYVDRGGAKRIYLLKGYGPEFFRFNVDSGGWTSLTDAPRGARSAKWDKGSWLAYDGSHTIYAHKAKYNELWSYDIDGDSWSPTQLSGMPLVGRSGRTKKSKDGGSAAWYRDYAYALKGGNTQEFWRYNPANDSWTELDTLPLFGNSGAKRKVKAGGDIASLGTGLGALKGNKTNEFWVYTPLTQDDGRRIPNARHGVMAGVMRDASCAMRVFPNPMRSGFASIKLTGRSALLSGTPFKVDVIDASGRVLQSVAGGLRRELALDMRQVPSGVYLVRLTSAAGVTAQKLVIQD